MTDKETRPFKLIAILLVGGILLFAGILPANTKFEKAMSAYNNGNYQEAMVLFKECDGFRHSNDYYKDCLDKLGTRYIYCPHCNELIDIGDY